MRRGVVADGPTSGTCWHCQRDFSEGEKKKYVYPLPDPERQLSMRHGAFVHLGECFAAITAEQKALGLLVEVKARPLEFH